MNTHKYISTQIEREIPQFIRMEYPNFVSFIKYYYEWLEQSGKPYHYIANILDFSDIDETSLQFLEYFGKNFLASLPDIIYDQNNIATLVKNIIQYYSARGSEKAFEFLFRIFEYKNSTNEDYIDIYYPSYDMLRVSDGKWVNDKSLKIINPPDEINTWKNAEVVGLVSGAKSIIDDINVYESTITNIKIGELFIVDFDVLHNIDKFICGEDIKITTLDMKEYYASIENVLAGIKITSPGKYYSHNQRIHITDKSLPLPVGEDARVIVDTVNKDAISGLTIVNGGSGYEVNDKVILDGNDFGTGAYGFVQSVNASGAIQKIKLLSKGHGYSANQKVVINSQNGTGAIVFIESDHIGEVKTVDIREFGINYVKNNTKLVFNTIIRVYDISIDFDIGETITGLTSNVSGVIEYWDRVSNTMSIRIESSNTVFTPGETIKGSRWNSTAIIYDFYTAQGEMIEGCVCNYKGKYINMDGHISSLKYIQDSYFYQLFSYMLKTNKDKKYWEDVTKYSHPAGTISFSLKDIQIKYERYSNGGIIAPKIETTEFYKFRWQPENYHGGYIGYKANTQIKQYKDIVIDYIANINNNIINKTRYCFGSEIEIVSP